MTRLHTRPMALVLGVAAMAAAGCGSSSSKSKPANAPTSALTPSTAATTSTTAGPTSGFAAQLNTLCEQGNTAIRKASGTQAKLAVFQSYVAKFAALTPPAAQKATYDKFVADGKAELAAAKANDAAGIKKATTDVKMQGKKLGAPACS